MGIGTDGVGTHESSSSIDDKKSRMSRTMVKVIWVIGDKRKECAFTLGQPSAILKEMRALDSVGNTLGIGNG